MIKIGIQKRKREETKEDAGVYFNLKTKPGRAAFICLCSMMELSIFFIEDASTLFVWWQTGLYLDEADEASSLSKANLYITVTSAVLAVVGLLYGVVRFIRTEGYLGDHICKCEEDPQACIWLNLIFVLPVLLVLGGMIFWAWFSLRIILPGGSYACLGGCQDNRALIDTNAADAAAFQDFMSASDVEGVGRRSPGGEAALYDAVAAMMGRGADSFSDETKEVISYLQSTVDVCDFSSLTTASTVSTLGQLDAATTAAADATFPFDFGGTSSFELDGSGSGDVFATFGTHADDTSLNRSVVGIYVIGWIVTVFGVGWTIGVTFGD